MKTKALLFASLLLISIGFGWIASGVQAAPGDPQAAFPSPTPGADGRIIYIVKAGDTCGSISLFYGVGVDTLISINQLEASCDLREGQQLILGFGGPSASSPTPGPSMVPTAILPTATPIAGGKAQVCVLVYDDVNGDGLRQPTEVAIAGAAISLTSLDGAFSDTVSTEINPDATLYQGMCFLDVPMGKYNISAAAPDGYNPTISLTSRVDVTAGDIIYIDYGAQTGTVKETNTPRKAPSTLMGLIGAVCLLAGIGIGVYGWSMLRRK